MKTIEIDGFYDIETEDWTLFVLGGYLDKEGNFFCWRWDRERDYANFLLDRPGTHWAHNGGRYDVLWLLRWVRAQGIRARCWGQGQRLTVVKIRHSTFRDSYALVPMKLEKGALIGKYRKAATDFPCVCEQDCGGYCSIKRGMSERMYRKLAEYLRHDCLAGMSMLQVLSERCAQYDFDLLGTVGGSSWTTAQRWLDLHDADWSGLGHRSKTATYLSARDAYFGGRTQVFMPYAKRGYRYDITSAYPAALANLELPWGQGRELFGRKAGIAYSSGKEGLYRVRIHVPKQHIPPLPVRGKLRLSYPYGTFAGTYASYELRYAQTLGARIERVASGLVWPERKVVFDSFCRQVWKIRDTEGTETAFGTWLKWFANSLTGRLAIRPESCTVYFDEEEKQPCPADFPCDGRHGTKTPCCRHRCMRTCGGYKPLSKGGLSNGVWLKYKWQIPESGHIHYAAFLTSHTRVELHKQLTDDTDEGHTAVYCDTDSVYATKQRTYNIDAHTLGWYKYEGNFRNFEALAPKTYRFLSKK